ncbi:MAG: hypothetical protein PHO05_08980 [bacterium]|nr:hypothetical protein [bacterium]
MPYGRIEAKERIITGLRPIRKREIKGVFLPYPCGLSQSAVIMEIPTVKPNTRKGISPEPNNIIHNFTAIKCNTGKESNFKADHIFAKPGLKAMATLFASSRHKLPALIRKRVYR